MLNDEGRTLRRHRPSKIVLRIVVILCGALVGTFLGSQLAGIRDMWGYGEGIHFRVTAVVTIVGGIFALVVIITRGWLRHGIIGTGVAASIIILMAALMDSGGDGWGLVLFLIYAPFVFLPIGFTVGAIIGSRSRND